MSQVDFSAIADASTRIVSAMTVQRAGPVPQHCRLEGVIAPQIGFVILLPTSDWNAKFIALGCGGYCGSIKQSTDCDDPLRRGYVCIVSDAGHEGQGASWAQNNIPSQVDFAHRAIHVTAVAGKALIEQYYGRAAKYAYFHGCSTGGRQALKEAQLFPDDFDGIIAGAPVIDMPEIHKALLWNARALMDEAGTLILQPGDLSLLHDAVLKSCDLNDGKKDGLIGNPQLCTFDPGVLACKTSADRRCLGKAQLAAVRKVYSGAPSARGYSLGLMKGSEKGWLDWKPKDLSDFVQEGFRYLHFWPAPGVSWTTADFDFERDPKRLGVAAGLHSATNPDLRAFKRQGGKLLAYMGWNDTGVPPAPTVDYYETVERTMGGRASTQEFFRLFMVPGMNHCTGGDGAFAIDYLSYLEEWVEKGRPPKRLVGAHPKPDVSARFPMQPADIEFERSIAPYRATTR